jgi:uncharacterized membrane protein
MFGFQEGIKMSSKKKSNRKHRNEKKAEVLGRNNPSIRPTTIITALFVIALTGVVGYFLTRTPTTSVSVSIPKANLETAAVNTTEVSYPVSMFDDGRARHFQHRANGLTIQYFVLKSSDGIIRAAFDACDVCWPAGKGYFQDGDVMVCRNCGRRFASVRINEVKGGCNPAPLTRTIRGNQLVIKIDDIISGQSYFNFKERA